MQPVIAIAEDHDPIRAMLVLMLQAKPYQVLETNTGLGALQLVRAHRPAVLLLDASLPALSGWDVARAIKADPTLRQTTIIMVTSHTTTDEVLAGYAAGADHYLTKPFSLRELLTIIEQTVGPQAAGFPGDPESLAADVGVAPPVAAADSCYDGRVSVAR